MSSQPLGTGGGGGGGGEGRGRGRPRNRGNRGKGGGKGGGGKGSDSGVGDRGVADALNAVLSGGGDGGGGAAAALALPPSNGNGRPAVPVKEGVIRTSSTTRAHMTSSRFDELPIDRLTLRAIAEVLKYELMTAVQSQTLPVVLAGHDVIAKAKTGTGKTIAFLLPTIERLARAGKPSAPSVRALAISPTRELASQIRDEAETLLTFHKPRLSSLVVFGGTNVLSDKRKLTSSPPSVLVATPGRLNDLLYNHGMQPLFAGLQTLIFDEADQLLEMGFRPDVTKILNALEATRLTRQTLLFSATLPSDVLRIAQIATRGDAQLVDTVGKEDAQTNAQVEQFVTITTPAAQASELLALLRRLSASPGYKLVIFFTTARLTQLYSELFVNLGWPILEMHSRKSQPHRTRVAEQFRNGTDLIMFSSDVSARGMDYPDVTAVVQVGLPQDKAQYIHRLGRTARAGKEGGGFLLLADFESSFLRALGNDVPIKQLAPLGADESGRLDYELRPAFSRLPNLTLACGYQAYLGFYNSNLKRLGWSREECVARANDYALTCLGLPSPPPLEAKTVGKMGLKGVAGIVVGARADGGGGGRNGGGKGGGKGGGGKGGGRGSGGHRGGRGGGFSPY